MKLILLDSTGLSRNYIVINNRNQAIKIITVYSNKSKINLDFITRK
jgi:hypothetical protein